MIEASTAPARTDRLLSLVLRPRRARRQARIGGGTRLKIYEAMATAKAVVSTTVGAEGLDVVSEEHLVLADEPGQIVEACQRLLTSGDLADRIRNKARSLVLAKYEASTIGRRIGVLLDRHEEWADR